MDDRTNARALVQQLSPLELQALQGLMDGESLRGFARRLDVRARKAADIRESMRHKLGVIRDAGAVRIGFTADIADHHSTIRKVGAS